MPAAKEEPKKEEPKKAEAKKGEEKWRYKHADSHPDNKPPLTTVAKATEENVKKYEDSVNAVLEKEHPAPPEEEKPEKPKTNE